MVCRIIQVSRSGYYREKKRKESEEIFLEKAIILCFKKHSGNYGRIRIRKELLKQGIKASEHKIARIMQEHGLKAKTGRKSNRKKAKNKESSYTQENLIQEKFKVYEANYLDGLGYCSFTSYYSDVWDKHYIYASFRIFIFFHLFLPPHINRCMHLCYENNYTSFLQKEKGLKHNYSAFGCFLEFALILA